jgi:hypothetical protein
MKSYLSQLLSDLEKAADNPPQPAWIEIPPHMEPVPDMAELALVPFKPISEWTGIDRNVFPAMYLLSGDECTQLNRAIFEVLESIHVEIIDLPEKIPPERMYNVITRCWDQPVQYLPSTGYDLELCTGNPDTCPYGDLCTCSSFNDFSDDDPNPNLK